MGSELLLKALSETMSSGALGVNTQQGLQKVQTGPFATPTEEGYMRE